MGGRYREVVTERMEGGREVGREGDRERGHFLDLLEIWLAKQFG